MVKLIIDDKNFTRYNFESMTEDDVVQIDSDFLVVLSHLLARKETVDEWDYVKVDSENRLLVTSSATKSSIGTASKHTPTTTSELLKAANSERKAIVIFNYGSQDVFLSFGGTNADSDDFPIVAGGVYTDSVWVGAIQIIAANGTADVRVMEYL